jgi:membrane-bound lytic murein transglycosylase F
MKIDRNHFFSIACPVFLSLVLLSSCGHGKNKHSLNDFERIRQKDTLTVLTLNTSTSYFIYRDQPMGYHYDMIRDFCDKHNLQLEIKLAQNSPALVKMLLNGDGDVIAYGVPVESRLKDSLIYCGLTQISHQVLVQRAEKGDTLLTDVTELQGKDITVISHTKYYERLVNLNEELGGGIRIHALDKDTVVEEDLIRMVSKGEIRYTVADEYIALLNRTYFNNIDVSLPVSFDQRSSWAVRKDCPVLADSLDAWFAHANSEPNYRRITKRYFEESKSHFYSTPFDPTFIKHGQISPYDHLFKKYGREYGIDWRLLASIAYQESTFQNGNVSWAGAAGIMGLMPSTAASLGVSRDDIFDPELNIKAATFYLKSLLQAFSSVKDPKERTKLALAAYNGGIGHVYDGQALAEKYGDNPFIWEENVEKYLQLKRFEKYYKDPVCKSGYFRGEETVNYVNDVITLWNRFSEKVKG